MAVGARIESLGLRLSKADGDCPAPTQRPATGCTVIHLALTACGYVHGAPVCGAGAAGPATGAAVVTGSAGLAGGNDDLGRNLGGIALHATKGVPSHTLIVPTTSIQPEVALVPVQREQVAKARRPSVVNAIDALLVRARAIEGRLPIEVEPPATLSGQNLRLVGIGRVVGRRWRC